MEVTFAIIIILISLLLTIDYLRKKRRNDMTKNMPGPSPLPFLGNALAYVGKTQEDIMSQIFLNREKYGTLYRVWIFNQLAMFSCNPEDVEIILSSPKYITKNTLYDMLHKWLGTGLLLSTGQKWHQRRKIITPTFHFKILEEFIDIFDQQSTILVERLKPHANETPFNIYPYITLEALDIIAETAMGTKVHAQTDQDCAYVRAVYDITNIMAKRFINVFHRFDWIFQLTAPFKKMLQDNALRQLHNFTEDIIKNRRATLEGSLGKETNSGKSEDDEIGTKKKMALLDVLLQATVEGKSLSNADIREEVDTFMFEGHDTTTAGMIFALYLISRHKEIQDKIFAEIREVIGDDKNKPIGYRELQDLKYLECVIKESLRLYPPVPIIGRLITEDMELNGQLIPAGTNYTIGIFVMLRDPKYFPDPDKFDPDRHTLENSAEKGNPFVYVPFSAGPRNCIGQKFAMLEMKSTISKILRHYELLPLGPEVKLQMNLVLRSSNGAHLGLKSRIY